MPDRSAQSLAELRALSSRMRDVREEERKRISREIHDQLGQGLTALKFEIAAQVGGETQARLLARVDELIRCVRVIAWDLRPGVLDALGLGAALEWLAADFERRLGIRCSADLPEQALELPPEMATDLFRICQELLTNVARHAQASRVGIVLELSEDELHFEVMDDGRGLPADTREHPSLGLLGIRERLVRWGGRLETGPAKADAVPCGCRMHIRIPHGRDNHVPPHAGDLP